MLIKHSIGEVLQKELVTDIDTSKFSLLIDESTDVSVCKYMCICIRYYSIKQEKLFSFLGLISITSATAEALSDAIKEFLKKVGLSMKNVIGIGTDGANNLCGQHHSVYTILKEVAPQLVLVK